MLGEGASKRSRRDHRELEKPGAAHKRGRHYEQAHLEESPSETSAEPPKT